MGRGSRIKLPGASRPPGGGQADGVGSRLAAPPCRWRPRATKRPPRREAEAVLIVSEALTADYGVKKDRMRNTAIWPRVVGSSGQNEFAEQPPVTPSSFSF